MTEQASTTHQTASRATRGRLQERAARPGHGTGEAVGPSRPHRRRSGLRRRRQIAGLLVVSPALVLLLVFFVVPMVLLFWMSLHNWPLLGSVQEFIGFDNYADIPDDTVFLDSILFTAKFALIVTPIQLVVGYALAMLVRRRFKGVSLFRTVYFYPVVVGFASGAYIFLVMIQPDSGFFDQVLQGTGLTDGPTPWLSDPDMALLAVVLMTTWKTLGTSIILLMVGMQAIPEDVREAAKMDGASRWQTEWRIILPLMRSSVALVLVLTLTGSFLAFDQFFVMTQGGPNQSTVTMVMWIYTNAFVRYRLGFSAALSIVLLVLLIVFTFLQVRALRDREESSAA